MNQRPPDLRQDQAFFGRAKELFEITHNLQRGRHTLLVGEKGIGKTRLMMEAMRILSGKARRIDVSPGVVSSIRGHLIPRFEPDHYKLLYIEHPNPLGDWLKEAAEQLYYNGDLPIETGEEREDWAMAKKRLTGIGSIKLQAAILEGLTRSDRPYLVFIDNLDRISPTQQAFMEALLNISVVCTAVVQMKEQFLFKRIWATFAKVRLVPLPQADCLRLIDYFCDTYPLEIKDRELYRREIVKAANGNPFHIKNMLWHGLRQKHINRDEIRALRQIQEGPYFNMGPIYIFGAAGFTMFKIFSIGTDNREFYIYFSALGFLVYLAFRVFRNFFLFRPQKYNR